MPIRFRCAYCNQLLGIARRKAGTVVRCPTCAGQVVVPTVEAGGDKPQDDGGEAQPQPLFERSDFDDLFLNPAAAQAGDPRTGTGGEAAAPAAAPPAGAWGTHADVDPLQLDVPRARVPGAEPLARQPPGIVLSPARATLLTVLGVVALAIAFGAGLLVGRLL
jgi:hypothetical protein